MGHSPRKANNQRAQERRAELGEKAPKAMPAEQRKLRRRKKRKRK